VLKVSTEGIARKGGETGSLVGVVKKKKSRHGPAYGCKVSVREADGLDCPSESSKLKEMIARASGMSGAVCNCDEKKGKDWTCSEGTRYSQR